MEKNKPCEHSQHRCVYVAKSRVVCDKRRRLTLPESAREAAGLYISLQKATLRITSVRVSLCVCAPLLRLHARKSCWGSDNSLLCGARAAEAGGGASRFGSALS